MATSIYPPLVAFLFIPLTALSVQGAALVMLVLNLAMGVACSWLAARATLRRLALPSAWGDVLVVAAVASVLVATRLRSEFQMWQTNVPMMLLLLLALRWLDLRPRLAGLALGMAVGVKYLPVVYLPYLLLRRRFRAAAWMVLGTLTFAVLPALVSGWSSNVENLEVAFWGLLRLLGFGALGPHVARVDAMTAEYSVSITSGLARLLGPAGPPAQALAIACAIAALVLAAVALVYRAAGVPLLRWPSARLQRLAPWRAVVAIEWPALMAFALAFGLQTNPRHTSLLLMVATPLAASLCRPLRGGRRWPAVTATSVLVFGLVFPPGLPGLEPALAWWRSVGGTGWCIALLPLSSFEPGCLTPANAPTPRPLHRLRACSRRC